MAVLSRRTCVGRNAVLVRTCDNCTRMRQVTVFVQLNSPRQLSQLCGLADNSSSQLSGPSRPGAFAAELADSATNSYWFHGMRDVHFSLKFSMCSATSYQSPFGLYVFDPHHFFSDPGPRNDQSPCANLFA